jgi:hypothetical protein
LDKIPGSVSIVNDSGKHFQIFILIKDHASRIGIALGENGICFCRLDGSLDSKSQDRCLIDFTTSATKNVLLASIQTAGVGLNITCASVAFIMVRNLKNQN